MLILASLYNLSDEQLEYQVRDRLSFMRFLERDHIRLTQSDV
jgi:IS5 family transposase